MYKFTDNATESGVATCDTDILNDNLMNLKYSDKSDFVVEAPNGIITYSDLTLTAPIGLKFAFANGVAQDKTLENQIFKLDTPATLVANVVCENAKVFLKADSTLEIKLREVTDDVNKVSASDSDHYLYNNKTNLYYDNTGAIVKVGVIATISATGEAITKLLPQEPFRPANYRDFEDARKEIASEFVEVLSQINTAQKTLDRLYKGVDLSVKFAKEIANYTDHWAWIKARIQAGNYDGIHVGDYLPFTLSAGTAGTTAIAKQNFNAEIAGIDTYYGHGDTAIGHHIDFVTKTVIDSEVVWNPTDNNNGTSTVNQPWLASYLYAWLNGVNNYSTSAYNNVAHGLNAANKGIYQLLPQALKNVIIQKRMIIPSRYSASGLLTYSTTWAWGDMGYLWVPTENEVYGCQVASSSHYNGGTYIFESMGAVQYPLFACHGGYNGRVKCMSNGSRSPWWLCVARGGGTTNACAVSSYGLAYGNRCTAAGIRVPVCFRIG